ncbi:MAG TPA: PPOX class F420-dependent oxidoreductase [Nitrososphaeraceae archaeon]|jgi:PPOX class probable F420-dependent enzyme|nr:PPOX class F420-dependent oxidoreductase [Nitrososphaeraceae archaeon]
MDRNADDSHNQMTESVVKLLQGKNLAFVSTLMEDGSPQVTPTWVDIENDKILVNTAKGRIKERNISRDPRVAVAVTDQNNPYHMVTIRGMVVDQTTNGFADQHIDKLAKKYLGLEKYPFRSPDEKRVILRIKPEKVFYQPPR